MSFVSIVVIRRYNVRTCMSEAHRSDSAPAPEAAAGDRNAKIEQLLLVGLDHYFGGRYEQAINVWTRALFLDRSHARARAYIERARTALAEAQRESEELLQCGVAAFHRGEGDEARRLLLSAMDRGAPPEEALAVLERLNRLEAAVNPPLPERTLRPSLGDVDAATRPSHGAFRRAAWPAAALLTALATGYAATSKRVDWRSLLLLQDGPATAVTPVTRETSLPLPRRSEMALARARTLAAAGHLRDALAALDAVRPTDPERADADRLETEIQRELLALAGVPRAVSARDKDDARVP